MEEIDIGAVMIRLAADLVQRDQPVVAVEDRVLHRLRHHRAGGLLQAAGEIERAGDIGAVLEIELQEPADELDRLVRLDLAAGHGQIDRVVDDRDIAARHAVDRDIGAIDRQCRCHLDDGAGHGVGAQIAGRKAAPGHRQGKARQIGQFTGEVALEDRPLLPGDHGPQVFLLAEEVMVGASRAAST